MDEQCHGSGLGLHNIKGAESVKKQRVLLPLSTPISCHMMSTGFSGLNNTREILLSFSGEKVDRKDPIDHPLDTCM